MNRLYSVAITSTPALVLVRETLERNLDLMQHKCNAAGVGLRPHGKMHKCSTLAAIQMAKGAVGICAQTIAEAEAFARAGIDDILITSPVALRDARRVAALSVGRRIMCVIDDSRQIAALGAEALALGVVVDYLIDIDLGQHRTGVRPDEVDALAASMVRGTRLVGIQGYAGHLQHVLNRQERRIAAKSALAVLDNVATRLKSRGVDCRIVTGGGTGTHDVDLASGVFTDIQPGSYAVMDVEYEMCDPPQDSEWPFSPALFIASTVISTRQPSHVTVNAGLKAMSVDGPPARVVAGAPTGSTWHAMGDEHGAVVLPVTHRSETGRPGLGDVVWLHPGHCDPTINLYDELIVVERDGTQSRWPIDARRMTRA